MRELSSYVPPAGLPSDLVFREARGIVQGEVTRIQAASRAVRLSADNVLLIRDESYIDLAASVDSITKEPDGQKVEAVTRSKTTDFLTLGAVIVGGVLVNSLLDCILGKNTKDRHHPPQ